MRIFGGAATAPTSRQAGTRARVSRQRSPNRVVPRKTMFIATRSVGAMRQPLLDVEKRPDQQAAIVRAAQMLLDQRFDGVAIEQLVEARAPLQERSPDEVDALPLEPARVRRREALLFCARHFLRDEACHDI